MQFHGFRRLKKFEQYQTKTTTLLRHKTCMACSLWQQTNTEVDGGKGTQSAQILADSAVKPNDSQKPTFKNGFHAKSVSIFVTELVDLALYLFLKGGFLEKFGFEKIRK